MTYICELCDFCTGYKKDYERHVSSKRHIDRENGQKNEYICDACGYTSDNKYAYTKHMNSIKHRNKLVEITRNIKPTQCEHCGKDYANKKSLWRHKQTCLGEENDAKPAECSNESQPISNSVTEKLLSAILQNQSDLQSIVITQQQHQHQIQQQHQQQISQIIDKIGTNHSHNTNTNATNSHNNTNTVNANKTFNINMYLNENCKNAIDIQDFVRTLGCSQDDLVENRHLDFTERVTKQIRDGFRNSTVEERPIHCSDAKRNTLHIRDNGNWISGNESKKKVWEIIKHLEHNYWGNFQKWFIENPECKILDTAAYEKYIKIYQSVLGPKTEMQDEKCLKKVMNVIADETAIDKTRSLA